MLTRFLAGICAGTALTLALFVTPAAFSDETKTKTVEVKGEDFSLPLELPEGWKEVAPGPLQKAKFEVPAAEGDTGGCELVVFHFGKGGGGGVQANIDRWTKQFDSEERKLKISDGESKQGKYNLVDLSGTWNKMVAMKSAKLPGSRMLAVILHSEKQGDFFIRLTGSEKSVTANAKAFRAAFGADIEKEKERTAEADMK